MPYLTPTSTVPDSPLRALVAEKLGRDPIEYARERREQGLSWARIADELKAATDVYLTQEAVRRWIRRADARAAAEAQKAA